MSSNDIDKNKIWWSSYPTEPWNDGGRVSLKRKVIQNDDHDQQNDGSSSRDMHNGGCVLVKNCSPDNHRRFEIKLFTNPNGANNKNDDYPIRMILSSYYFENGGKSIPDGKADCSLFTTTCNGCKSRKYIKAYDPNGKAYSGYGDTRVHRDQQIIYAMRNWMHI